MQISHSIYWPRVLVALLCNGVAYLAVEAVFRFFFKFKNQSHRSCREWHLFLFDFTCRKIEIVKFARSTRQAFVRLLALVKWASSAAKVDKCAVSWILSLLLCLGSKLAQNFAHLYHIHSNKCLGCLDKYFVWGCLFVSIFVARIDTKMDDFGIFRLISSHIDLSILTFINRSE